MKDSKWLYVVLSIAMAVILWGYVIKAENPDQTRTVSGIPVTFTGTDVLATRNLIISEGAEQTMDLTVKTKLDIYSKLDRYNITLKIDVSKIVEPKEYHVMVDIAYPPNVSTGSILLQNDLSDLYVDFTVSKLETKEIPVKGEFTGSVAPGYQAGEISVTPATVGIRGQRELVNQVAYAEVRLNQENMDKTYTGDLSFVYIGMNGEELADLKLSANVDTVHVVYPVVMVKEVPLTVDVLPGGGAT
ncbi:MAG: CdaR family protein, partial [Pseudoflavonifractor sp.]